MFRVNKCILYLERTSNEVMYAGKTLHFFIIVINSESGNQGDTYVCHTAELGFFY
jgi:hypothetical protein